jgi:hypothetical protein
MRVASASSTAPGCDDEIVGVASGTRLSPSFRDASQFASTRSEDAHVPHDALEDALLGRLRRDSRELEPGIREVSRCFAVGDEAGAVAVATELLDGSRVPALTVSLDVLDEIALDRCATLVLAHIDGMTVLSWVLGRCGLSREDALRTMCELVERRIVILRSIP